MANAVEFIDDNLDPQVVLNHYGFKQMTESDDYIRACCAIHNGSNPTAFCWNKKNNLWACYTGDCGGGDIFTLIEKIDKVDFVKAISIAAEILGLDILGMDLVEPLSRIKKQHNKWLKAQRKKLGYEPDIYEISYSRYTDSLSTFTRFKEDTIKHYKSKFCKVYPTEDGILHNKLVIPIYDEDSILRGCALRDTTGECNTPKWYYVPKGFKKGHVLYNYDAAISAIEERDLTELILVEGIFDVWKYHEIGIDNVAAILGSSVSAEQESLILQSGVDVTLSFDNDKAGNKCLKQTHAQFKKKLNVLHIQLPIDKDPADCSNEELMECYIGRTKLY